MVAKITVPGSLKKALNYNEQKVRQGVADCIYAHYFLKDADHLTFHEKLDRFARQMALNKRAATNTLHISLNFGVGEQLAKERLIEIAASYMDKIGFGKQPYLVYQHHDAGHPHIHIVTTNILKDGKRISLHNIGRNQSEVARKEVEVAYGLQKAQGQWASLLDDAKPVDVQQLVYGKSATKQGIVAVLDAVLPRYKYASLAELNAVLKRYNVVADRGEKGGLLYQKRGLLYRALDAQGNKVGVPVKASSIYNKPTLDFLEGQFAKNAVLKQHYIKGLRGRLDWILRKPPASLEAFGQALEREKISLEIRKNEAGVIYGLTYIDHHTKCVFNGSEIGKAYSAKAILEICGKLPSLPLHDHQVEHYITSEKRREGVVQAPDQNRQVSHLLNEITGPVQQQQNVPYELGKRAKRRRKKQ